jgi:hypothetical protein
MSKTLKKEWLMAESIIQASNLELVKLGNGEDSSPNYGYMLLVQYRYHINEKVYVKAENFHYSGSIEGERQALWQAKYCYPVGSEGIIYYNPCNPEESTLYKLSD